VRRKGHRTRKFAVGRSTTVALSSQSVQPLWLTLRGAD